MLSNKNTRLLSLLLLFCLRAWTQAPGTYAFTHYKIADGLAASIVYNAVQDEKGFMWLATINGLQRFDGNKFLTFKNDPAQPSSLPADEVNQLYEDRHHTLWVLTGDNKVGTFNTATFTYQEVPIQSWTKGSIYTPKTFLETSDGKLLLYVNYTDKLFELNSSGSAFVPSYAIRLPEHFSINALMQDRTTQKLIATTDSGFVVYNPRTKNVSYTGHNTENEPLIANNPEQFVHYQYMDANRNLFFEQWPKNDVHPNLKVFNLETGSKQAYNLQEYGLGYHLISAMLQQRNGRLWVCGLPFLAAYTTGSQPFQFIKKDYTKEKDLKFSRAFSMYEDRQGNVWVCTDYGLYVFNPDAQLFHSYTLTVPGRNTVEGRAQTAMQLGNGEVWVGYRDLGLYRYDRNLNPLPLPAAITPYQKMKSVWDIQEHRKTGTIWITLQGGQLIVYDTATRRAQLLTPAPFEHRAITQIVEDKQGNLWFGTQAGNIVKWAFEKVGHVTESDFSLVTKTSIVNKLLVDAKGYVWAASFSDGVLKIDPSTNVVLAHFSKNSPHGFNLWNNAPTDIIQYNDSLLLVATGALNFINTNTNRVQYLSTRDGLPSNTVSSLAKDAAGVVWLGTLNGLCRADLDKRSFAVYDQNDGLPNEDFNAAGAFTLQDGRLLFTSVDNFVVFDPLNARNETAFNKAIITDFKVSNVSLPLDSLLSLKQVKLPYNQSSVAFEFSALNYSKQNKLDFYYRLQNFDTVWTRSDNRHQAVYNFLPPGDYQFEVKTKNIDGVFSNAVATLRIVVNPPFWATWWFYVLLLLLAIVVLYLIDRERMQRLRSLHNVRLEIASHLHMDVSTTLNNINVLSQIAKLKADKDIVRSKELIDEISEKSYNMVANMDEILWSIDPDNDTMEKMLLRLFEYAETLETNYGAAIDIVVHEKVKELRLNMKLRHDFFIACKEVLQRLVHDLKSKRIFVDIDLVRSRIILRILSLEPEAADYNTAFSDLKEQLEEQAMVLQGHLNIESGKKETSIELTVPFK